MKILSHIELSEKLSRYVDGVLSEPEVKELETYLSVHPSARQELNELLRLKELLSIKHKVEPNTAFWTRLSATLEERKKEEENLLPFPRKYIPMVTSLLAVLLFLVGIFVVQKRMPIFEFLNQKSQAVRVAYEKNVLKGTLFPLFAKVDKDQALQFSLLGILPLDEKNGTTFRVDAKSDKGYRIEVGKAEKRKTKNITVKQFLADVKPTAKQKQIIDSLLEFTSKRIESSILIGENNAIAIDPALSKLNRAMVTSIAASLEPQQRICLERLMAANDAPFAVTTKSTQPVAEAERIFKHFPQAPQQRKFMVITPDTMMYSEMHINMDSLRNLLRLQGNMVAIQMRRQQLIQKFMRREFHPIPRFDVTAEHLPESNDSDFFRVEINTPDEPVAAPDPFQTVIAPRIKQQVIVVSPNKQEIQIRVYTPTQNDRKK